MKNGVRIALLIAGAAIVGAPSIAAAQDQPQGERHQGGGNWDRGNRGAGGERGPRGDAPTPAPGAGQAGPYAGYAQRRMDDAGRHYQTPGQPPAAPAALPGQPQPGGRDYSRFGVNRSPQGDGQDAQRRFDGRQGYGNRPGDGGERRWDRRPDGEARGDYRDRAGFDGRQGFGNPPGRDDRRFTGRPGYDGRRFDDRRGNDGRGFAMQGWRGDRRYDWRGFRDAHRQIFRAPRYIAPRGYGYGYRPFSVGVRLDPFFYGQSYWIDDPWEYRLPPADGPYRWVRYYNDVLLVDLDTGEVLDVIRDFFW